MHNAVFHSNFINFFMIAERLAEMPAVVHSHVHPGGTLYCGLYDGSVFHDSHSPGSNRPSYGNAFAVLHDLGRFDLHG